MPSVVYLATSAVRDYPAAGAALATQAERRPGWILREGMILSFASLREPPLSVLCDGDIEEHETGEWAHSDDLDMQYRLVDLLKHTVTDSYADLRWHKERSHVHFRATSDLSARKAGRVRVLLAGRSSGRTTPSPSRRRSATTIMRRCSCGSGASTAAGTASSSRTTVSLPTATPSPA